MIRNILLCVICSLAFFACSEDSEQNAALKVLRITANVEPFQTKAFNEDGLEQDKQMIVFLRKTDNINGENYIPESFLTASFKKGNWELSRSVSLDQGPAYVFAAFPYDEYLDQDGKVHVQVPCEETDYLYAGSGNKATETNPTVNLTFKRALTLISFNLKRGNYQGKGVISNLDFIAWGMNSQGILNVMTGEIEELSGSWCDAGFRDLQLSDNGWETKKMPSCAIFPCEKSDWSTCRFEFTIDGREYTVLTPDNMVYEPGKHYIFTLEIGSISNLKVETEDWVTNEYNLGTAFSTPMEFSYVKEVTADNLTITVPTVPEQKNMIVHFGDKSEVEPYKPNMMHTYAAPGTYLITIQMNEEVEYVEFKDLSQIKNIDFRQLHNSYAYVEP